MKCDNCGRSTTEKSCKIVCPNCGQRMDCSDLFPLYICKHFECEVDEGCYYCENYKDCVYHRGSVEFDS